MMGPLTTHTEILQKFESQPRLTVIHHKINRGYGGALKTGLMAVDTDYAVTIDADGQHQLSDIEKLLDLMLEKDADMIVGSRVGSKQNHWYRELGKWIIRRVAAMMMPMPLERPQFGFQTLQDRISKTIYPLVPQFHGIQRCDHPHISE